MSYHDRLDYIKVNGHELLQAIDGVGYTLLMRMLQYLWIVKSVTNISL